MTQSNTNAITTVDEATVDALADQMLTVVNHYRDETDGSEKDTNRLLDYGEAVLSSPADATDAYLAYFADDPAKGREIIEKIGVDASFADLDMAIKDGTISTN